MTAPSPEVHRVAAALLQAWQEGTLIDPAPLAGALAGDAQAYEVQQLLLVGLQPRGPMRHWKSGGSKMNALAHAPLPDAGVIASGAQVPVPWGTLRGIEAEIALRIGTDVSAQQARSCTDDEAAQWVDAIVPTIELVATHWSPLAAATPALKLADLQSHGALAIGDPVAPGPRDWAAQACEVTVAGVRQDFRGSHPLGDPYRVLPAWLRYLADLQGTIPAGTVVTTGTWCGLLPVQRGDEVVARFPGIGEVRMVV